MKIFLARSSGGRDEHVYVNRDDRSRTLSAEITDARSTFGVKEIVAKYPSLSVTVKPNEAVDNKEVCSTYTVSIGIKISDNYEAAKQEMGTFAALLSKLNGESFSNHFYLDRTEFFNRQCKSFIESLFGKNLKEGFSASSSYDRSYGNNAAF